MDDAVEKRKESFKIFFKKFFSNKYTVLFVLIILLAFTIRVYYFAKLYDQPCWWDECDYLSSGKSLFGLLDYKYTQQRPVLFPLLAGIFFYLGLKESIVRFLLSFLPSMGVVIIIYFLAKIMYDERVALIATFLWSVFWVFLFDAFRFHTDSLALFFALLTIYFFWKYYVISKNSNRLWLIGVFLALAFMVRIVYALFVVLFLVFLLLTEKFKFLKQKNLWIAAVICLLVLTPFFVWSKVNLGSYTAFKSGYTSYEQKAEKLPIAWSVFDRFPLFTQNVLLIVFILSLLYILFELAIGYDIISSELRLKSNLFLLLLIIIPLVYFVFIERSAGEPRWFVFFAVSMFSFIGVLLVQIYEQIHKHNRYLAVIVILSVLVIGAYQEIRVGNASIIGQSNSFLPLKLAGEWLKINSNENDIILTKSVPQVAYYSGRKVSGLPGDAANIILEINDKKPRYIIVAPFDQATQDIFEFPGKHPENFKPVYVDFVDKEKKQPILAIYEVVDYKFTSTG